MKKASRKILHGVLDLLPITIIGVFAIHVQMHEPNQTITYPQNQLLDFNQLLDKENYPATKTINGVTFTNNDDGTISINGTAAYDSYFTIGEHLPLNINNKYLYRGCPTGGSSSTYNLIFLGAINTQEIGVGRITSLAQNSNYRIIIEIKGGTTANNLLFYPQLYDLTQIYGASNEPTLVSDFINDFPLDYYPYITSEKILNKNVSEITYDNTDIGSQMVYSLYQPINDYFNLNNVANFEQVYDFFQIQFFNGNAPVSIFIVWNIILYQFIMDLIFLVYMVFMFIIDFIEAMLDFMFRKSFGGAR